MAASYQIAKTERLKLVKIVGKTNYEELEGLFLQYLQDPDFEPDLRLLVDLREMTDAVAGLWEISRLKRLYQRAYRDAVGVVDVVILTGNDLAYHVARAFKLFMRDRKPMNIRIVSELSEALEVLNVNPGVFRTLVEQGDRGNVVWLHKRQ